MREGSRVVVLLNPIAFRARAALAGLEVLRQRCELAVHRPCSREDTTQLACDEAARGCAVIVAAGGDGTVNRVARALAGSDLPMGILPVGTANDLAHHLGIPLDPAAAAHRIMDGAVRRIDLVEVNGQPFCTVGGIGLGAATARSVDRLRSAHPLLRTLVRPAGYGIYSLVAATRIAFGRRVSDRATVTFGKSPARETRQFAADFHALFVTNQPTLAATLALPTGSRNDDGCFELCLMPAGNRARLLRALWNLKRGRPAPDGTFEVHRATRAVIVAERDGGFLGDGDQLCREDRYELGIRPAALGVIA